MKLSLAAYLSHLTRAAVVAAQEGTRTAVQLAARAEDELALECDIGGQPFRVPGAANLPHTFPAIEEIDLEGAGYLEYGEDGKLQVRLKQRLSRTSVPLKIKLKLRRSAHLESMETMRERAVELVREEADNHRAAMAVTVEIDDGPAD